MSTGRIPSTEGGIQPTIFDAKADILTATAADTPARLAVGANGTVLTANSATATGLEWGTVSAGGMTLISTATPSAATTVSFTSIPTTYKHLLLVWDTIIQDSENVYFSVRLNNDSNTNYNVVGTNIVGSAGIFQQTNGTAFGNSATSAPIGASPTSTTEANRPRNGFMWIYNADQTTGIKTVSYSSYGWSGAFTDWVGPIMANGRYLGTSAISRIDLIRNSTQTITGTIRLYGVS